MCPLPALFPNWTQPMKSYAHYKPRVYHGLSRTKLYKLWQDIRKRCSEKCGKKNYPFYYGAGVRVCAEWQEFLPFYKWAKANGYRKGLIIDRKDGTKGYGPGNCRWVDVYLSAINRKKRSGTKSKYRGVCWWWKEKRWQVVFMSRGVRYNLGTYTNEEDAARAYDAKAWDVLGELATLNFPENYKDE